MDNETRRKLLRYTELVFKEEHSKDLSPDENKEKESIPNEVGLTHLEILFLVERNLFPEEGC